MLHWQVLGHPASPTPKAVVTLSRQQPYTDRLQCWGSGSGKDVGEIADEEERRRKGRWEMAQGEKEEQQNLNDYISEGERIKQYNPEATCNFSRQ